MPDQKPERAHPSRLAQSAYLSPYANAGAPSPHPNTDPWAPRRAQALATLEAMGFEPDTMVERGIVWAEDQDPFGHVMNSQYMHFINTNFHRMMEFFSETLSEKEYDDMLHGRTITPVIHKYELNIRRQVQFPDSLIAAHFQDVVEPTGNNATVVLFSLKQQAIVVQLKGTMRFMDTKTGRAVDIRKLEGGWPRLYEAFVKRGERSHALRRKWLSEHPKAKI
ncbi:hypothetical protein F4780DRAFT_774093 [Xylariomycetidae sp. FL0641]|nr:hypothetical protein F4780DRAFT_774093 [Xylariomycetidae sp. FL0641]